MQYRKIERLFFAFSFAIAVWSFMYPHPYGLVLILALALLPISIGLTWYNKGLMKMDVKKPRRIPPLLFAAFLCTALGLAPHVMDYNIYQFTPGAWLWVIILVAGIAWITIRTCKKEIDGGKYKALIYLGALLICGLYGFALFLFANCYFDHRRPDTYQVQVVDKHFIHARGGTRYYVNISAWGRFVGENELFVTPSLYDRIKTDDNVTVCLRKGNLGMSWYWLHMP